MRAGCGAVSNGRQPPPRCQFWNRGGRKEYRYLSPSFLFHPKTRQIVRLKGAGLVHNPNLHLKALARQEPDMTPDAPDAAQLMQSLVKMLGLGPDATKEGVLAALVEALAGKGAAKPDPKKYVPVAAVQAMMRERNTGSGGTCRKPRRGQGQICHEQGLPDRRSARLGAGTLPL